MVNIVSFVTLASGVSKLIAAHEKTNNDFFREAIRNVTAHCHEVRISKGWGKTEIIGKNCTADS